MTVFGAYAQYYDTLYQDKDYTAECDFLEAIFRKFCSKKIKRILDLGCGTAGHGLILAERGYTITGVDRSPAMLKIAKQKAKSKGVKLSLYKGDAQTFRLPKKFDAAIAMFAVMGYQITPQVFLKALKRVRAHLVPGGLFTYDVWFGPAVVADLPKDRQKIMQDASGGLLMRETHCQTNLKSQVVKVTFTTTQKESTGGTLSQNTEYHPVRYFFLPETLAFLKQAKFDLLEVCPFMKLDQVLDQNAWNMSVIARAIK